MKTTREMTDLTNVLGTPLRSKKQINKLFQADCEILKVSAKNYITTSCDSIGEEITIGLYQEINTWAWLTVMNSVSDLAASGSSPLGLTLSTQWAMGTEAETKKRFFAEVNHACRKVQVPLLGGDSGAAKDHVFTSSIVGHSSTLPLTRMGAKDGDYLVLAHNKSTGAGPALALSFLLDNPLSAFAEDLFRPLPSWKLAHTLRPWASAAIDTSDGLAIALYTLALLNNLGFEIQWDEKINHPKAVEFCKTHHISPIMLWLGDLGDLQTLFVVPAKNIKKFKRAGVSVIGRFHKPKTYQLRAKSQLVDLPMELITRAPRDTDSYSALFKELREYLSHSGM